MQGETSFVLACLVLLDIKGKRFDEKLQVGKESEPCATVAEGRNGTEKRLHWDCAAIDLRF